MRKPHAVAVLLTVLVVGGTAAYFLWPARIDRGISPCFLLLLSSRICEQTDLTEVLIDGRSAGRFEPPRRGYRHDRIVFEATGAGMTFAFRIMKGEKVLYEPQFVRKVSPGDMLDAWFSTGGDANKPPWGPESNASFEALADGVPPKVWCWFLPANARTDRVNIRAADEETLDRAWRPARRLGYRKMREWRYGKGRKSEMRIAPPKGVTVVQAVLELEQIDGLEVALDVAYVY